MNRKGFTLIELLIIIAIIGFLAAAILVAVDPVKRIGDSRDARRSAEANAILNAILTKQVDDRAIYDGEDADTDNAGGGEIITGKRQIIVSEVSGIDCMDEATRPSCYAGVVDDYVLDDGSSCVADLSDLVDDGYIAELPIDPRGVGEEGVCLTGSDCVVKGDLKYGPTNTGYYIYRSELGEVGSGRYRIEIGSCSVEGGNAIKVAR